MGQICRGLFQSTFLALTLRREPHKLSVRLVGFPTNTLTGQFLSTVPKRRHLYQLELKKQNKNKKMDVFHLLMPWNSEWNYLANPGAYRRDVSCMEYCSVIERWNVWNTCCQRKGDRATWEVCLDIRYDPGQLSNDRLDVAVRYENKKITSVCHGSPF